jgi:hypothetical protein
MKKVDDAHGVPVGPNDVVQIDPEHDDRFGGCFLVVTEVKPWGVQGYVSIPDAGKAARAYYRVKTEHMVLIGPAEWAVAPSEE